MTSKDPTVFLVDDDAAICKALTWLLHSVELNVEVYPDGQAYLENYNASRHGCIVSDIRMPRLSGLELLEALNKRKNLLPIIFITAHGDVPIAVQAMQKGAMDLILKPFHEQALLEKIQKAIQHDKLRHISKKSDATVYRLANLTPRELEVTHHIVEGKINKQIAAALKISISTVEFHRANIMRKLHVQSIAELVRLYMTHAKL